MCHLYKAKPFRRVSDQYGLISKRNAQLAKLADEFNSHLVTSLTLCTFSVDISLQHLGLNGFVCFLGAILS